MSKPDITVDRVPSATHPRLVTLSPEAKRYIVETTVQRAKDEPGVPFKTIFEETVDQALALFGDPRVKTPLGVIDA